MVRATMIAATLLWAFGETLMGHTVTSDRAARLCWTAGIALALIHVVLAFQNVYAWDHEAAVEATARQAAEVFGVGWRGGILVNYIFLAVWLADVVWWWAAPVSRSRRPRALEMLRLAFFVFMFLNGAVIFAAGFGRVIGLLSLGIVTASVMRRLRFTHDQRYG